MVGRANRAALSKVADARGSCAVTFVPGLVVVRGASVGLCEG